MNTSNARLTSPSSKTRQPPSNSSPFPISIFNQIYDSSIHRTKHSELYLEYFKSSFKTLAKNFVYMLKFSPCLNQLQTRSLASGLELLVLKTQKESMNGLKKLIEEFKRECKNKQNVKYNNMNDQQIREQITEMIVELKNIFIDDRYSLGSSHLGENRENFKIDYSDVKPISKILFNFDLDFRKQKEEEELQEPLTSKLLADKGHRSNLKNRNYVETYDVEPQASGNRMDTSHQQNYSTGSTNQFNSRKQSYNLGPSGDRNLEDQYKSNLIDSNNLKTLATSDRMKIRNMVD